MVDSRSPCGLVTACELDLYSDQVALCAWNIGPLEQCPHCSTGLVTRVRQPGRTDLRATDRRPGTASTPRRKPYQPIHEQRT